MSLVCYYPIKGIDDVIAKKSNIPSWNSYYVANLRGMYEEVKGRPTEDVEELKKFRASLRQKEAKRLKDAITNPSAAWQQLKETFTTEERVDRVNMIASVFSSVVDALQEQNPSLDREDIIRGFFDESREYKFGPAFIYNEVYKVLRDQMQEFADFGYREEVRKFQEVFRNWAALVVYADTVLRDTEGMKVSAKLTFSDNIDITNFGDDTLVEQFVMEESTKESWQEASESVSPFGAISPMVRKVLGRLTKYKGKEIDYDDLGFERSIQAVKAHQHLMEVLRGMQSESDMVTLLKEEISSSPYLSSILKEFEKDPILRTQFFVDFSRSFQLYSMQIESKRGGVSTFENKVLNTVTRKAAVKRYLASISTKSKKDTDAIFKYEDHNTTVNEAKAKELADYIESVLGSEEVFTLNTLFNNFSNQDRVDFYKAVLPALGIQLEEDDYNTLSKDNKRINDINKALKELPFILRQAKSGQKYKDLIKKEIGQAAKEGYLHEKLSKILQVTDSLGKSNKLLSRVRFLGNNYYSDTQSSYLGRFRDVIDSFARKGDQEGLQRFLKDRYLNNSYFISPNNKIYNKWSYDLYYSKLYNKKSFANMFTYKKLLGDSVQKFEDFTSRKQALLMINEFNAESKDYAWYPVFILGDSGASKWIRAPKYSSEDIINGLYNVFLQEKEFQKKLKELKNGLVKDNKSLGSLAEIDDNKFGCLPFLNEKKYADMVDMSNIEQSVKNAIKQHLEDGYSQYELNLRSVGLFEQNSKGIYKYLNKLASFHDKKGNKIVGGEAITANLKYQYYNTKFATIMQMQLMTVNPIFYKNGTSTDLQKRYKEIHASGNKLSVDGVDPYTKKKWSNTGIQKTVYFNDVKVNPENTNPEFMEVIAHVYGKNSEIYNKYKNGTSYTDGQGYRTLESYRAVMGMSGKWNKKCENAYNEIENIREQIRANGGEISEEQSKRLSELAVNFQPIKPFMYTLEEAQVGNSKFQIPVQMKYAETMMIPELLPKESRLRHMLEWAENNDVDVIAATTAVKVGSFGSVDVTTSANKEETFGALDRSFIHNLSYNDYIIQTNVPEHIQGSQLFATQSRKLIFANLKDVDESGNTLYYTDYISDSKDGTINLGRGQVPLNAHNLNRFWVSLISANVLENFNEFSNLVKDPDKVRNALIQMTVNNNRESRDNLRGYSKSVEDDFLMQLFEGGIEHDTAALLLSNFKKKVNKQKINGGSAVQVSAFGINGYNESENLKFVTNKDNTNVIYAECEIPFDLSYTDADGNIINLNFDDWCNPDGSLKIGKTGESLLEEFFPGITSFIAYRIPTEEHYSMMNLKIKRFSRKVNGGGTIKVPAQGTTIAGFDFDIDKLYFMRREYVAKKDQLTGSAEDKLIGAIFDVSGFGLREWKSYDYTKPAWDNSQSRAARNNMMISLMQKRLEDPQTIKTRTTPGGFSYASKAAKYLRKLTTGSEEPINYDFSDPWTMVVYNQQNQIAGKLIGIFANQNTNNAISSLMKEFSLVNSIAFGSHPEGLRNLLNAEALTKELLAAAVDAVKDPVLNFLGLNTITADSAGMLCRLGYSFEEIGLLMNQPIIKKLCDYCMDNNMSDINTAINNLLHSLGASGNYDSLPTREITTEFLEKNLQDFAKNNSLLSNENKEFVFDQARILELFRTIYATAKDVSRFVTNTKFTAANAVKSTFGGMYAQQDKVEKYVKDLNSSKNSRIKIVTSDQVDNPITLRLDMLANIDNYMFEVLKNPFGYEQVMYDANVEAIKQLGRYYPYSNQTYTNVRRFMSKLTKSGLSEGTIDSIHQYMLRYMIANCDEHSKFNPDYPITLDNGETIRAEDYYTKYVPSKISSLLSNRSELKELPIFEYLEFEEDEDTGNITMRINNVGALTPVQKEEIRDSWESLLDYDVLRDVAQDLYMYSYYKDGFGFGIVGFNHLAPLELKLNLNINSEMSYTKFLRDVLHDNIKSANNIHDFAREFIKSHVDSTELVYEPKGQQYKFIRDKIYLKNVRETEFTLDLKEDKNRVAPFVLRTNKSTVLFRPAISIDGMLYIADGIELNESNNGAMTYRLAETLGEDSSTLDNKKDSSTAIEGENVVDIDVMTNDELIDALVAAQIKTGTLMVEQREAASNGIRSNILQMTKESEILDARAQLIGALLSEYKTLGVCSKANGKKVC